MVGGRWARAVAAAVVGVAVVAAMQGPASAQPAAPEAQLRELVAAGRLASQVLEQMLSGGETTAIVTYDDRDVQRASALRKAARGLKVDDPLELQQKAAGFANLKAAARALAGGGITTLRDYRSFAQQYVRIDNPLALLSLLRAPGVERVNENGIMRLSLDQSLPLIGQPAAEAAGETGEGTSVAVIDTGVNYLQAAFGCTAVATPAATCKVAYVEDIAPDDGSRDDDGHGTNVSGIVVGVAPDTKVIGLDVFQEFCDLFGFNCSLGAQDVDILSAVDWVIQNQAQYNIVAVNLSLGQSEDYNISSTQCWGAENSYIDSFTALRAAGVLPVVAAGNDFFDSSGTKHVGISKPGCTPGAISVGAVYDSADPGPNYCPNYNTRGADKIACFSQTGSLLSMLAPGCAITAAGLANYCGTSMATPHVAGGVAVLAAAGPTLTPSDRECALTTTGPLINDTRKVNSVTLNIARHRLYLPDALAALGTACGSSNPAPTLTDISPANGPAGTGFELTVTGTNFVDGATIDFGGISHATTFDSSTQLRTNISAGEVTLEGTRSVQVCNPAPGGGCSTAETFTVDPPPNPVPSISGLSPLSVVEGSPDFELVVSGSGFVAASEISFGGVVQATTFNGANQLKAIIAAADVAVDGLRDVTVCSPSPGGGCSPAATFTVTPAGPPFQPAYLTVGAGGIIGNSPGLVATTQDIVQYDGVSYTMYFDGSDVGLSGKTLDGFQVLGDGSILLSTAEGAVLNIGGVDRPVDDSDIVRFFPTSTGPTTSGTFEAFFTGSFITLTTSGEDVDAFYWDETGGMLYLSTSGGWTMAGSDLVTKKGKGRDIAQCQGFVPQSSAPCAKIKLYFDGDDIGLSATGSTENIDALFMSGSTLYFSTSGAFNLEPFGLTGQSNDVFACTGAVTGGASSCADVDIVFAGANESLPPNITGYEFAP